LAFCLLLSGLLTYAKYAGSTTAEDTLAKLLEHSTQKEISDLMLLDNTYTPPFAEAGSLIFDSEGITYNETRLDEKFVVF